VCSSDLEQKGMYKNKEYTVSTGEFGWEINIYYDHTIKASYCLTYAKDSEENLEMLRKAIKNHTKASKVIFNNIKDGDIDHRSDDVCAKAFKSEKSLINFIFNPKSFLATDNDNH
jgi:hypothetical protein